MFWIPKPLTTQFPTIIGARYTVTTGTDVVGLVQASASRTSAVGGDDRVYEEWVLAGHAVDSIQFQEKDKVLKNAYGPKVKLGAHPNRMPWSKNDPPANKEPTTWTRAARGYGEDADFLGGVVRGLPKSGKARYVEGFSVISIAGEDVPDVREVADEKGNYRGWFEVIRKGDDAIGYVYAEWTRKVKGILTTRIWQLSIADSMDGDFTVDTGHPGAQKPANFTEWYTLAYEELSKGETLKVQFADGEARGHKSIKKVKKRP